MTALRPGREMKTVDFKLRAQGWCIMVGWGPRQMPYWDESTEYGPFPDFFTAYGLVGQMILKGDKCMTLSDAS